MQNDFCDYAEFNDDNDTIFCKKSDKLEDCDGIIKYCSRFDADNPDHERDILEDSIKRNNHLQEKEKNGQID